MPWAIAAIALLAAIVVALTTPRAKRAGPVMRLAAPIVAERLQIGHGNTAVALSPDGKLLAYHAFHEGKLQLWVRSLTDGSSAPVPNTEDAQDAVWSPDSTELAYRIGGKLWRATPRGERAARICDATSRPTWGEDGTIVMATADERGLERVSAAGGTPEPIAIPSPPANAAVMWPVFTGRNHVAYCVVSDDAIRLHVIDLRSGDDRDLGLIDSRVEVVDGVLLFAREGALHAQRVDAALNRTSEPVQIASDVSYFVSTGTAKFSASSTAIAYVGSATDARATWFDRSGNVLGTLGPAGMENPPRISADGRRAVLSVTDPHTGTDSLWVCDVPRSTCVRITKTRNGEYLPVWSPDGKSIAYVAMSNGATLFSIAPTGTDGTRIATLSGFNFPRDWLPQGIVVGERASLALIDARPGAKTKPLLKSMSLMLWARVSPDGKWIAYTSAASGNTEVYVAPVARIEDAVQVSSGGAMHLAWRGDSSEVYYSTRTNTMYAARMKSTEPLDFEPAQVLFHSPAGDWDGFDVTRDGERFLITRTLAGPPTRPINVIVNWQELLGD